MIYFFATQNMAQNKTILIINKLDTFFCKVLFNQSGFSEKTAILRSIFPEIRTAGFYNLLIINYIIFIF